MSNKYILAIDQSTSGTKAMVFNDIGDLIGRSDISHDQIISDKGWVEHNPMQIYQNTIAVVKAIIKKTAINKDHIVGIGISNQRETAMVWNKKTGEPIFNAVVWQCARGEGICNEIAKAGHDKLIKQYTGMNLSPYFSAAKISWILQNAESAETLDKNELCCGTMDSWLIYKLTNGKSHKTDYSNASRTQLFNIHELNWDAKICELFGIPLEMLPQVCDSNSNYGETDFEGFLNKRIPINGVLGDSQGALFGQGCLSPGMVKATYGTGSSVVMNIGNKPILSNKGLVTSIAWGINGHVNYIIEGNINYTGAVIKWLIEDVKLIDSAKESEKFAESANKDDATYIVPAFTGLGAPYWDSKATATITGMTRTTGKAEIVKAAVECIAYQIADVVKAMGQEADVDIKELRVDGGPTRNKYLMQFQSDLLNILVRVPNLEELSGIGAAYLAGITLGIYKQEELYSRINSKKFKAIMDEDTRNKKYRGWKNAVNLVISK